MLHKCKIEQALWHFQKLLGFLLLLVVGFVWLFVCFFPGTKGDQVTSYNFKYQIPSSLSLKHLKHYCSHRLQGGSQIFLGLRIGLCPARNFRYWRLILQSKVKPVYKTYLFLVKWYGFSIWLYDEHGNLQSNGTKEIQTLKQHLNILVWTT